MAKKNIYTFFVFATISTIFLLIFSFSTSFIYKTYGFDSAIFMVMGKAVANGKQMYIDVFDHKGPILFFIQYLGWKIGRVPGIFLLQVINLTCVLYVIYKTCLLLKLNLKYICFILFSFLSLLGFTNIEGNQSEEYSLLFLFIPLFFATKYIFLCKKLTHPPIYSFVYGACFCCIAFNRLTNAAAIGGIFLAIILILLLKKQWNNLLKNIIFFTLGFTIIFIPIILHFYYYNSLDEMIYSTFLYNIKYAEVSSSSIIERLFTITNQNKFRFFVRSSPNILLIVTSIFLFLKRKLNLKGVTVSVFIAIFTYIAINTGLNSYHYATINTISLVLGLILLIIILQQKQVGVCNILKNLLSLYTILMIAYFVYQDRIFYSIYKERTLGIVDEPVYTVDTDLVNSLIKEEDRNSVFGYNIPPEWYLFVDMIPPFKFFTNHESWIASDSIIYFETNRYLVETPPTWIVIPDHRIVTWTVGIESNPILKKILEDHYKIMGSDINHKYYRRID